MLRLYSESHTKISGKPSIFKARGQPQKAQLFWTGMYVLAVFSAPRRFPKSLNIKP